VFRGKRWAQSVPHPAPSSILCPRPFEGLLTEHVKGQHAQLHTIILPFTLGLNNAKAGNRPIRILVWVGEQHRHAIRPFDPSMRAIRLGLYSFLLSTSITFFKASSETLPRLCNTRSTVPTDTPAALAMSFIRMFSLSLVFELKLRLL